MRSLKSEDSTLDLSDLTLETSHLTLPSDALTGALQAREDNWLCFAPSCPARSDAVETQDSASLLSAAWTRYKPARIIGFVFAQA